MKQIPKTALKQLSSLELRMVLGNTTKIPTKEIATIFDADKLIDKLYDNQEGLQNLDFNNAAWIEWTGTPDTGAVLRTFVDYANGKIKKIPERGVAAPVGPLGETFDVTDSEEEEENGAVEEEKMPWDEDDKAEAAHIAATIAQAKAAPVEEAATPAKREIKTRRAVTSPPAAPVAPVEALKPTPTVATMEIGVLVDSLKGVAAELLELRSELSELKNLVAMVKVAAEASDTREAAQTQALNDIMAGVLFIINNSVIAPDEPQFKSYEEFITALKG